MNIEELANIAESADSIENEIKLFCESNNIEVAECINKISLYVANGYSEGILNYEYCDSVMNLLFSHMTDEFVLGVNENCLPEPAYAIYLAFDEGEYHHRKDDSSVNPIEKYTNPQIEAVLANAKST